MGVPSDPGRELDEMMAEVKAEVAARKWTGGGSAASENKASG